MKINLLPRITFPPPYQHPPLLVTHYEEKHPTPSTEKPWRFPSRRE